MKLLWVKHDIFQRAFSLVEIVVALGVISFSLIAVIGLLPIALASGRASIQETRANHLAEQIFTTLRGQSFTSVNLASLGSKYGPINLETQNTASSAPGIQLNANYQGQFVGIPDYFAIKITFRNSPDGLVTGSANEVRVEISPREIGAQKMYYISVIGAR